MWRKTIEVDDYHPGNKIWHIFVEEYTVTDGTDV